jgi:hypothetical protein
MSRPGTRDLPQSYRRRHAVAARRVSGSLRSNLNAVLFRWKPPGRRDSMRVAHAPHEQADTLCQDLF